MSYDTLIADSYTQIPESPKGQLVTATCHEFTNSPFIEFQANEYPQDSHAATTCLAQVGSLLRTSRESPWHGK